MVRYNHPDSMDLELTDKQSAFQQRIVQFARETIAPEAAAIDERGTFPSEMVTKIAALGLLGVTIPAEWGGAGLDYISYALGIEAISSVSAVLAVIAAVNNSLVAEPIAHFGTEGQKNGWLRRLASGQAIGAFALSEEHAGSDAANQQSTARLDDRGYVINGRKVWVANAEVADLLVVFASTQPGIRGRGVSAFLVPMDTPGITRIGAADSLGVRGLGCLDLAFTDVRVGSDSLLGNPGDGFRVAMWALDGGRVAIAAQALGVGAAALQEALSHAKSREAFGQPIGNYQAIQWMLADMATELDAARMLTLKAADSRQRGSRPTLDASMAKLFASEAAHRAADRAMQILASTGYRRGSVVERLFRDVRATEIYQGTSEVQRMVIAEAILS
ncbi:MAG TPA: acyl-CoA dehydrogenase family protein [Vicinamibacterales bacterium]|nr:acyl-CoA dehydrogenase family protein [Vicinamibacterales bacterium]